MKILCFFKERNAHEFFFQAEKYIFLLIIWHMWRGRRILALGEN